MRLKQNHYILLGIILIGALLRLYMLGRGDAISDEVLYGFRAIGMLDFDFAVAQPTTLQLFNTTAPWWVHLSFHDHPLLVFFIQHVFMGLFGVNLWGMRLSSSLFGIASIFLVYLIAKKLFSERAGLLAAALMASNVLMVYVSRVAIQESQVIFFILLSVYFFLRSQDDQRWYLGFGVAFGLGLLSKYTIGFLVLPLGLYLLIYQRSAFRKAWFYLGSALALFIASPFIIYNIYLYRTFGHFDFQLFYIFGQHVSYWVTTPGKDIGSLSDRFIGIGANLWQYDSWLFIFLTIISIAVCVVHMFRVVDERRRTLLLLTSIILVNLALYLAIGPSPRFLTLVLPWLCIAVAYVFTQSLEWPNFRWIRLASIVVLILFCTWESVYSYNSTIAYQPAGPEVVTWSRIHWDVHAWGFNELDHWLSGVIRGKYPKLIIPFKYQFLEDVKSKAVATAKAASLPPTPYLFVYNDNVSNLATLWLFDRHALYEAWPIITADSYREALKSEGDDFYSRNGFTDLYFIQNTDNVLANVPDRITDDGGIFEKQMQDAGIKPLSIMNHAGKEAFRIYHETLHR